MIAYDIPRQVLNIPVRKCMRCPPVTVAPSTSIIDLMYTMNQKNIGSVVVEEKGRALGVITEKDILVRAVSSEKDLYSTRAREIMSTPIRFIDVDRPIKEALELMHHHNLRRLVVIENEAIVGIVTERRLLAEILKLGI
ncbi:MAG: CBS domain-containing protein [Candidatus Bathyarchaeota archaeon]|nr:MAG: CBS domain-containing protein [Candidatus Bathyarchaeota archaeon]